MPRSIPLLPLFVVFALHGSAAVAAPGCATVGASPVGVLSNEQFGRSVAYVDVNHDGYVDLLVGAPGQDHAYLYLGGNPSPAPPISSTASWTFNGPTGSATGICVTGLGDVDGDGYDDIAVGAPLYQGVSGSGAVFVFRGGPSGPSSTPWVTLVGTTNSNFGAAVCSGDLDGDGRPEVVVGAPTAGGTGAVVVFRYYAASLVQCSSRVGQTTGSQFGASVATSDMDGDGLRDLAVGAPGVGNGSVQVYGGRVPSPDPLSATYALITGDQVGSQFGAALSGGINIDGDANDRQDLLVGEPLCSNGTGTAVGRVFLFPGTATLVGASSWSADGDQSGGRFGSQLAAADITGDGRPDVLVSEPLAGVGGRVFLFGSPATGPPVTTPTLRFDAEQSGSQFGAGLAAGGSVNRDGIADFVVGAPLFAGGVVRGKAYVYLADPTADCPGTAAVPGEAIASGVALEIIGANPFHTSARIAWTLPHESTVQVRVLDLTGRVVQVLASGVMQAGRTDASWNGRTASGKVAPAGVYFVEMRAPGVTRSIRVVKLI